MKKEHRFKLGFPVVFCLFILLFASCKQEEVNRFDYDNNPNATLPQIVTGEVSSITKNGAKVSASILSNGRGTVTVSGIVWGTQRNPVVASANKTTNGASAGTFSSQVTGLEPYITYYVRAYATNSAGTAYGEQKEFTTLVNTVIDVDGNEYNTIAIGNQVWMAQSLRVKHYRNGDPIAQVTDNAQWPGLTSGAYGVYPGITDYGNLYGFLYNWYAVDDSRNIAPEGWHVPTDAEWTVLTNFLGGVATAGGTMKDIDLGVWMPPNLAATNSSGFKALPGGYRDVSGPFVNALAYFYVWSSTSGGAATAWSRGLVFNSAAVDVGNYPKKDGFAVRCIKD